MVIIVGFLHLFIGFKSALPHKLLDLRVAEHLDLFVGESALDTVIVPAETVIVEIRKVRTVVQRFLRVHEEGVGFSVVAEVRELKRKEVILTIVSTYRM